MRHSFSFFAVLCLAAGSLLIFTAGAQAPATQAARELHVAVSGDDGNDGSAAAPFKTISAAAAVAQPEDTVTVHEGCYREWVNPPRGGESDAKRIVYQAAPGETVEVKGSEVMTGWEPVQNDTWKVVVPNSFFGDYNPYADLIHGDWFSPKDRPHHTGAVYLNGEWLIEAAKLEEALAPAGTAPSWLSHAGQNYLLNVAWLQPHPAAGEGRWGPVRSRSPALRGRVRSPHRASGRSSRHLPLRTARSPHCSCVAATRPSPGSPSGRHR